VFGWFGEGEPPPLARLGDYEDDALYVREIATETWNVSYFDLLENATDIAHTEFLHWHFGNKAPDKLEWRETEFGLAGRFEGATGKADLYNRAYFEMPTSAEFAISGRTGREGYFTCAWRVPRDDDSAIRFNLFAFPRAQLKGWKPGMSAYAALRGLATANAEARDASETVRTAEPVEDAVARLLDGREDMKTLKDRSAKMNYRYLTNLQDYAVLASLGAPSTRNFTETFGRTDASIALMRRVFLRELKALAEGRPLKDWQRPAFLWQDVSALHRAERDAAG
jgi:5,5'-dehydrodivanillate O-demethylase